MKTITFLRRHFFVAIALLTAGVTMSFKMAEKSVDEIEFFYNSNDLTEGAFATVTNWSSSISPNCQSLGKRPCKMSVPEGTLLSDQIGGKTNAQVLAIHEDERRP